MSNSLTPQDPISKTIEEAAKIAEAFLGKLLDPSLEETGGILGDTVKYWRFKNAVNLVLKAKAFLESKGIQPARVLPKTLLPIIENGSLEEDEHMRDRWVALLAHAADPGSLIKIKPSYPEILKELSPLEARILDNFYSSVKNRPPEEQRNIGILKAKVLSAFGLTSGEYDIIADNLFRLNLCQPPTSEGGASIGEYPIALRTRDYIELTALGVDFIKACTFESYEVTTNDLQLHSQRQQQNIPEELIDKYATHVVQTGGIGSRQVTKVAWLLTEHGYINPPDRFAVISFNGPGDVMGLSPNKGYRITTCHSPSGNEMLDEPGYPLGCRIVVEDKLKNEVVIECEKI